MMRNELLNSNVRPNSNETGIVNLQTDKEPGSHWVAYRKKGTIVEYFDSFGNLPPPQEIKNYFPGCKIYYNYNRYQNFNTYNCGHLCLKFLCSSLDDNNAKI